MLSFLRRFIYTVSNKASRLLPSNYSKEKIVVDFSRTKTSPFIIKPESSYNAYLSPKDNALVLGLKKSNYLAWLELPELEYHDHVIEAKIRLDSLGGYAATGLLFHMRDDASSYYMALVSSKGYFRLDLVKDGAPKTLIAWTDFSDFDGSHINLNIITYGTYLIFVINGKWIAETNDDTIRGGMIGFALASYEETEDSAVKDSGENEYTCSAYLEYISIDPEVKTVEEAYKKWSDESNINAESRLRLAETFAVMGDASRSLDQIIRAWKRRDEAIRGISIDYTEVRTKRELLLAARMASRLEKYNDAEEYINPIIEQWVETAEGKEAVKEKIKILTELKKFAELKEHLLKYSKTLKNDADYFSVLARCHFEINEYEDSAAVWDKVFNMKKENGVYAANAGNAYELAGKNDEALLRYLEAGKLFLKQDNTAELIALMPKISTLGEKHWEARVLAGKWAFSLEDYNRCLNEFAAANRLRCAMRPRPKADPAHYYLWGITHSLKGRNYHAIRLLERAVRLAPDYGLFRFKLVEARIKHGIKDPKFAEEFKKALKDMGDDPGGKMKAYAGELLIKAGDKKNAKYFLGTGK
jgi:tetratricopeptide (TPR) repeat protein